jgi:type IV pilus assembly protein PilP
MMNIRNHSKWLFSMSGALLVLALSACSDSGQDSIQAWMNEQRATIKPNIKPISEPKKFEPRSYDSAGLLDPFNNQRLTQALQRANKNANSNEALVAPEINRRKEALEAYPLDVMGMVGSVNKGGQPMALVRVDKLVYQVRVGNYLGQNFGKITKISETSVTLREIVQDATGEWVERNAQLELQERSK